jgi:hypothetical protein
MQAGKDDDSVCGRKSYEDAGNKQELGEMKFIIRLLRTSVSINI